MSEEIQYGEPFFLRGRTSSMNIKPGTPEFDQVNEKINRFHNSTTKNITDFKSLFLALLDTALDRPVNDDGNLEIVNSLTEQIQELKQDNDEKNIQIEQLMSKLTNIELQNQQVVKTELPSENPFEIKFNLNQDEHTVIHAIKDNRIQKGYEDPNIELSELARKMLLNRGTIFNYGGEFYTGLG